MLVHVKEQNSQILKLLKTKNVVNANVPADLPDDLPVTLPILTLKDLKRIEEYLNEKLSKDIKEFPLQDIKGKCMLLPFKNEWVSLPLFHTL